MHSTRFMTPTAATRVAAKLDALLVLTRSFSGSRQDGVMSDTLDLLLGATGYTRGAAYALEQGALELCAHRGLPAALRQALHRLPLAGAVFCIAQRAAQERVLVTASEVATPNDGGHLASALALAGWTSPVACPIALGRDLHGVMVLAGPSASDADEPTRAMLEIACQLLVLPLSAARPPSEQRREEAAHMAALGLMTSGILGELDEPLAELERDIAKHERIAEHLRTRGLEHAANESRAIAARSAAALRSMRATTERLVSLFETSLRTPSPEPPAGQVTTLATAPATAGNAAPPSSSRPRFQTGKTGVTGGQPLPPTDAIAPPPSLSSAQRLQTVVPTGRTRVASPAAGLPPRPQRDTVLVVEDDDDLRRSLCDVLQEGGYDVEAAENGQQALERLAVMRRPQVIVLDLMMPVMNGWQFLRELKRDQVLADIPVVVVSAGPSGLLAPDAREYLRKPVDYAKLFAAVHRSAAG